MIIKENKLQTENLIYNIAWLRKHHKISKKKMAEILNISIYSLNKIESGNFPSRLGVDVMFTIWERFGISPVNQLKDKLE